jgi:hypothetical protein
MNDSDISEILKVHGPMTAKQIAVVSDMTPDKANVNKIRRMMKSMSRYGLVREVGAIRDDAYHPSTLWELIE